MALACDGNFLGLITTSYDFKLLSIRFRHREVSMAALPGPLTVAFVMWLGVSRQSICQWIVVVRIPNPPLDTT